MNSIKHIAILTPGFPKDEEDYYCIPPLQRYLELMQETYPRVRITVIAFQYPYRAREYEWKGIRVIATGGNNSSFLRGFFNYNRAWLKLKKAHAAHPIQVVHSFWMQQCALMGAEFQIKFGVNHVCTVMGQDAMNFYFQKSIRYPKLRTRWAMKNVKPVAISQRQATVFENHWQHWTLPKNKIHSVIPWGIAKDDVPKAFPSERTIDIIAAGSLIQLKNYPVLIALTAQLKKDFPNIQVTLAGSGPDRNRLWGMAQQLGVAENINFLGEVERPKLLQLMRDSKLFVHPSTYEGQGYACLEALASGCRVVSGPVGIAANGERWKIVESPDAWEKTCREMLQQPILKTPLVPYTMEWTLDKYVKVYQEK